MRPARPSAFPPWPLAWLARHTIALVTATFALVATAIVSWWPRMVYWSPDCAAKFLQITSIRFDGELRYDVPYVGRAFDPLLRAIPLLPAYYDVRGGQVHIVWPELFALLGYPFYRAFGPVGVFVVPIVAGAASVLLAGLVAERIREGTGWIASLVTASATPVLVYSVLLWEHTAALALALLALWMVVGFARHGRDWRVVVAAAMAGLASAGFRADVVLFAVALFSATFLVTPGWGRWRVALLAVLGFVLGSAPAWAMNLVINGSLAPSNAARNLESPHLGYIAHAHVGLLPHFLVGTSVPPGYAWATTIAAVVLVAGFHASRHMARRGLVPVVLAAAAALVVASLLDLDATRNDRFHGWLAMCPVLVLGCLRAEAPLAPPRAAARRVVALTAAIYGALLLLAIGLTYPDGFAGEGNMEWGPRYWLALFPLMAVLVAVEHDALFDAVRAVATPRTARALALVFVGALLLVGVDFNRMGVLRIRNILTENAIVRDALLGEGDTPLLTDMYFLSPLAPELFARRPSFLVWAGAPDEFSPWLCTAFASGLRSFVLASFAWPGGEVKRGDAHPFLGRAPECDCTLIVDGIDVHGDVTLTHLRAVPKPPRGDR